MGQWIQQSSLALFWIKEPLQTGVMYIHLQSSLFIGKNEQYLLSATNHHFSETGCKNTMYSSNSDNPFNSIEIWFLILVSLSWQTCFLLLFLRSPEAWILASKLGVTTRCGDFWQSYSLVSLIFCWDFDAFLKWCQYLYLFADLFWVLSFCLFRVFKYSS